VSSMAGHALRALRLMRTMAAAIGVALLAGCRSRSLFVPYNLLQEMS
jgi:hypothetical protein